MNNAGGNIKWDVAVMENSSSAPKSNLALPRDPAILLLGIRKIWKQVFLTNTSPEFHNSAIHNSQQVKQLKTQMSINRWRAKWNMEYIYIHNNICTTGYYLAINEWSTDTWYINQS